MVCKRRRCLRLALPVCLCFGCFMILYLLPVTSHEKSIVSDPHRSGDGTLNLTDDSALLSYDIANSSSNDSANVTSTKEQFHCASNDNLAPANSLLTIDPFGQLGNRMFQYAGLLGVARMNHRTPFVLPRSTLTQVFQVTHVQDVPHPNKWKGVGEPRYASYDPWYRCLPPGPLILQCYFQSYKYFQDIESSIKREFSFKPHINQAASRILSQLTAKLENVTTVGVHIRRGDKLTQKEIKSGEMVAPVSFFHKAFQWMRDRHKRVVFLVTSDDRNWMKVHLNGSDVILIPPAPAAVHLSLLTKCQHTIMSVGTFGWWAGWLAGGDVIYYNQPLVPGSWKGQRMKMDDYYPKHWIGLPS